MKCGKVGRLWHIFRLVILLSAITLPLHGCARRAPVEGVSTPRQEESPARQEEAAASREKESGAAAGALLVSARQAEQAGQFSRAEMALERALRLAPRDAKLWREMALLKLKQDDYGQAEQFCLKSNTLAGDDRELTRKNWVTLEKIYARLGKTEKVAEARRKALASE
ncbi:MAG: tetratricopeptide repeat protein [Deltaproteobacteria bacterium]|nr:tetratricopeptide repeat protein [Deltaproteobacteria bacterium]